MRRLMTISVFVMLAQAAFGGIVISEWMYNGVGTNNAGEFVELTNTGPDAVDMTGWSFDDDSRIAGTVSLSAFGVVAAGQSVILTDETAETFATIWGLSGVSIIGGNMTNLGRNDEINIFDAAGNLVDRLTYGDENYPGTIRAQNRSCSIPTTDYLYDIVQSTWVLAATGDAYGSWASTRGEIGSPGRVVVHTLADLNCNGAVDQADLDVFTACASGPMQSYDPLPSGCTLAPAADGILAVDYDRDGDVDQSDFGVFQRCISGTGIAADAVCTCGGNGSSSTEIVLNGNSISVQGSGVTVAGTKATITSAGTYSVRGTLTDGQIEVNSISSGTVTMVLNGVSISNSTTAPIYIASADETAIVLATGSTNSVSDPANYVFTDPADDEPNAAIFSKDDLTISGSGTLTVNAHYNDGITSKDSLTISDGTIIVNAVDDGIRGKDSLLITGGSLTVVSGGDALKSDNDSDTALGYITVQASTCNLTAGGDGITAETNVNITGGTFTITTAGGSNYSVPDTLSAKAIKGNASVNIGGGTITLNTAEDGVHSNTNVTISGGTLNISAKDDGIHSDDTLLISGGTINITKCYEGLEGLTITINNGTIHITSSDDGINGAGGVDGSGGPPSGPGGPPPAGSAHLYINGGYIVVNSLGDGLDANGNIDMTGGTVIVSGPTANDNGAIDYDGTFKITGGFLVAAGSSGMAQAPSTSSTQRSVKINYAQAKAAGTLVNIQKSGVSSLTFAPPKQFQSLVFSAPTLVTGSGYTAYRNGSSTGTVTDGLYSGGTYTPGTQSATFTISSIVTNVSNAQ